MLQLYHLIVNITLNCTSLSAVNEVSYNSLACFTMESFILESEYEAMTSILQETLVEGGTDLAGNNPMFG